MSTKKSSLTYEPVSAWDSYATTTRRRQVNALAQRYIEFLSACKTERETIAYVQKRLAELKAEADAQARQLEETYEARHTDYARQLFQAVTKG